MRWALIPALLLAGCTPPAPVTPPPALTAPTITGVYAAPVAPAPPAAAVPTAVYYGYPSTYGVMLCLVVKDPNLLCWYPPV
jgi:hypothetical protein